METKIRITGGELLHQAFQHSCGLSEAMFAGTLMERFGIPKTVENAELVQSWLKSARDMGVVNFITCGLKAVLIDPNVPERPRVVCLCGSTRFSDQFRATNLSETLAGRIVLSIGCDTRSDAHLVASGDMALELKARLDELHKRKIEIADEILVINPGGYVGHSTHGEIAHARRLKKTVRWSEPSEHMQLGETVG